jgi:hypothetical protein
VEGAQSGARKESRGPLVLQSHPVVPRFGGEPRRGPSRRGLGRGGGSRAAGAGAVQQPGPEPEPEASGAELEQPRPPLGPQRHRPRRPPRLRRPRAPACGRPTVSAVDERCGPGGQRAPWPSRSRRGRACAAWCAASRATASTCTARRAAAGSSSGAWSPALPPRRPRCAPGTAWLRSTASTWRARRTTRWVPAPRPPPQPPLGGASLLRPPDGPRTTRLGLGRGHTGACVGSRGEAGDVAGRPPGKEARSNTRGGGWGGILAGRDRTAAFKGQGRPSFGYLWGAGGTQAPGAGAVRVLFSEYVGMCDPRSLWGHPYAHSTSVLGRDHGKARPVCVCWTMRLGLCGHIRSPDIFGLGMCVRVCTLGCVLEVSTDGVLVCASQRVR